MKIPHHRRAAAAAYTRAQTPPPIQPAEARPASEAKPAAPSGAERVSSESAQPYALSADEQQMIDRYFPPQPEMALRLYGPGRDAQTVSPTALGGRLDLNA